MATTRGLAAGLEQLQDVAGLARVDGRHGLVGQDHAASLVEGAAHGDPLLLAAGELAHRLEELLLQAEVPEEGAQLLHHPAAGLHEVHETGQGRVPVQAAGVDVVEGRQLRHQGVVLVHAGAVGGTAGLERPEQGRLAGAAGADDDHLLAALHPQVDAAQGLGGSGADVLVPQLEER